MFGPEGHQLGNARGFRGWSGGFRDRFTISASDASPGYIPGPITPGRWHLILGPYTVAPQGLAYQVQITLTAGSPGAPFRPNPAPTTAPARQRGRSWYRGDCHLHTVYSYGRRTPEQLVACTYEFSYELADLVEVWNGPWDDQDQSSVTHWDGLLRSGEFIPAIGDSDAHNPEQTVGLPHTVVLADSLAQRDLLAGLKAGRSWLAESAAVQLQFTASAGGRTAGIGDRLPARSGTPVTVTAAVSGVPGTTVTLLDQLGPEFSATVPASGSATVTWTTDPRYSRFVRAEVRRAPNAMVAMTNPIFLGVG